MTTETKAAIRECAKAVCSGCRLHWPITYINDELRHGTITEAVPCGADNIRARFPEAFEEAEC